MRPLILIWLILGLAACASPERASLARFLNYRSLTRVTETQIDVAGSMLFSCRDPRDIHGPHLKPGIHLFVSLEVIHSKANGNASRFPIGSLLVKEKFDVKGQAKPSIITVMEKIADQGRIEDWRFHMVRLSDRSFVPDQATVSCVDCHARYAQSDFVSPVTDQLVQAFVLKSKRAPEPTPSLVIPRTAPGSYRP